jgi:long-chain acyl-CoA synthetase
MMYEDHPWLRFYGKVPTTLAYPEVTLYRALAVTARRVPEAIAWDFFGTQSTYAQMLAEVDRCAAALATEGLREGDRFLISMPSMPQVVVAFYAANRLLRFG